MRKILNLIKIQEKIILLELKYIELNSYIEVVSFMIKENRIKKKFQMYARSDTIVKNPVLFRNLKEVGLEYLTVGFESFSSSDLKKFNKKTSVEMNNEVIRTLKKLGIYINAHFIVDPEYTVEDFKQQELFAKEIFQVSIQKR